MRFDPISFLIGFLSATGLSLAVWRLRMRLAYLQETAETQIEETRQFVGRSAAGRYQRVLLRYLQGRHVAGDLTRAAFHAPRLREGYPAPSCSV